MKYKKKYQQDDHTLYPTTIHLYHPSYQIEDDKTDQLLHSSKIRRIHLLIKGYSIK